MRTIHKFLCHGDPGDTFVIQMPEHARILHFMEQRGTLCIWAEVRTTERKMVSRTFVIFGTGYPISDEYDWIYCGTAGPTQEHGFIWHLYVKNDSVPGPGPEWGLQ
jgi:hypothetical protein